MDINTVQSVSGVTKLTDKIGKTVRGKRGHYKIQRQLSKKGGMGIVFVAETKSKTEVVIKFAKTGEDFDVRLRREAKILREFEQSQPEKYAEKIKEGYSKSEAEKLSKPRNIVPYVDESEDGASEFFLVMEKLEGLDLKEIVGNKKLDEQKVIKFSRDIAEALVDLHHLHTIHRDLKPDNLIVTQNGEEQCILIDFGIGKLTTDDASTIVVWTPQWSCKHNRLNPNRVDVDCDIYALGRVMFYMATGQEPAPLEVPYGDPRFGQMQYKADKFGVSPELSDLIDDMISYAPPETSADGIIRQMEPAHKIQTGLEVIQRLERLNLSANQQQIVQPRKHTVSPPQQQYQPGPHIILGGDRYQIKGDRIEIGRKHDCPDPDRDCSRGVIYADMDGFDYPCKPDQRIEIPLRPVLNVTTKRVSEAESHHIRIWKDKGKWFVRDLDTRNYSAIRTGNNWELLNDVKTGKGKIVELEENWAKIAISYRSGGRTGIEFSFFKQ